MGSAKIGRGPGLPVAPIFSRSRPGTQARTVSITNPQLQQKKIVSAGTPRWPPWGRRKCASSHGVLQTVGLGRPICPVRPASSVFFLILPFPHPIVSITSKRASESPVTSRSRTPPPPNHKKTLAHRTAHHAVLC